MQTNSVPRHGREEKTPLGEKDIAEKILLDYEDVCADVINALVYKGENVIEAGCLRSTGHRSAYRNADGELHEQERDVVKKYVVRDELRAVFGIENQTCVDKNMPFRVLSYDGASYKGMLTQLGEQGPVPVITIVLYYGDSRWTERLSLLECLGPTDILKAPANDYRIKVYEIAWLTDEEIKRFKSDFRIIANFFVNRRKNPEYEMEEQVTINHVDAVLKLISAITNDNRYEESINQEGEIRTMCDVAERIEQRGIQKGLVQGIEQGIEQEKAKTLNNLVEMIKRKAITLGVAAEILGLSVDEFSAEVHRLNLQATLV